MLDVLFPLDRRSDVVVILGPNQPLETIPLCEPLDDTLSMLPGTSGEVASYADIKRSVASVRHHVDPTTLHAEIVRGSAIEHHGEGDGWVKPGHDDGLGRA